MLFVFLLFVCSKVADVAAHANQCSPSIGSEQTTVVVFTGKAEFNTYEQIDPMPKNAGVQMYNVQKMQEIHKL